MFELISYEKFRDTKDVRFFDISVNESNYRDLVIHSGPATVSYTHLTLPTTPYV